MKRGKRKGVAACFVAAVILVGLTACGSGNEDASTQPEAVSQESLAESVTATIPAEETQPQQPQETQTQRATAQQETQPSMPQTTADLIGLYEAALARSNLSCRSQSQSVDNGKLWMGSKDESFMDLLASEQAVLLQKFQKSQEGGALLSALVPGTVSGTEVSGNTVTFLLNDLAAEQKLEQGSGSYLNIVDTARTRELVDGVKEYANISGNVKITTAAYVLSGGKLTAVFDDSLTKLVSVKFSAKQKVTAEMKYLIMTIHADVQYRLTSEYR